ncbi:hypothetical protein RUM44_009886 [Polyplax serrata]|uniref:Uncharacterized protein n=1 Tax=Polyplax serrata TaxID=468196 RepID=A0ABR1ATZ7_POLSC
MVNFICTPHKGRNGRTRSDEFAGNLETWRPGDLTIRRGIAKDEEGGRTTLDGSVNQLEGVGSDHRRPSSGDTQDDEMSSEQIEPSRSVDFRTGGKVYRS